jgi:hypothetical protein
VQQSSYMLSSPIRHQQPHYSFRILCGTVAVNTHTEASRFGCAHDSWAGFLGKYYGIRGHGIGNGGMFIVRVFGVGQRAGGSVTHRWCWVSSELGARG